MNSRKLCFLMIGLATALAVAGCGGGNSQSPTTALMQPPTPAPAPTPPPTGESFTNWSKVEVYAKPADNAPIEMPLDSKGAVTAIFDGDDNPNAYSDLFSS